MYFPSSQVEVNLTSNGEFAYKTTQEPYFGIYFSTSNGKYYTNSPDDTVIIELVPSTELAVQSDPLSESDDSFVVNNTTDLIPNTPDARFETFNSEIYSLITNAPLIPPHIDPPPIFHFKPNYQQISVGYAMRYFVKKVTKPLYIEISKETYNKFRKSSPSVAFNLYKPQLLIWYLTPPGTLSVEESNLINVLEFEEKVKWPNFSKYLKIIKSEESFKYTEGNEFLYPDRTSYVGYYHIMSDGTVMTGKEHGDSPEIKLIVFKPLPQTNQTGPTPSQSTQTSSPSGGGSSGGGGY
jgi:hypothetical protein